MNVINHIKDFNKYFVEKDWNYLSKKAIYVLL